MEVVHRDIDKAASAALSRHGSSRFRFRAHVIPTKGPAAMALKVGINGFGRIGRNVFRAA